MAEPQITAASIEIQLENGRIRSVDVHSPLATVSRLLKEAVRVARALEKDATGEKAWLDRLAKAAGWEESKGFPPLRPGPAPRTKAKGESAARESEQQ
jgi:hypothetical protein